MIYGEGLELYVALIPIADPVMVTALKHIHCHVVFVDLIFFSATDLVDSQVTISNVDYTIYWLGSFEFVDMVLEAKGKVILDEDWFIELVGLV